MILRSTAVHGRFGINGALLVLWIAGEVPPRPSRSRNRYTLCLFCTYLPILPHSQMTAEDSHATSTVLYRRLFIQYFLFFILTASVDFQIPSSHYLSLLRLYVPACDSLCVQQAQMVSTIMLIYRS